MAEIPSDKPDDASSLEAAAIKRRTPPWIKKITRADWIHSVLAFLLARYLAFVYKTTRWTFDGVDEIQAPIADKSQQGYFIVLWHDRLALMPLVWQRESGVLTILNSSHQDGRLVGKTMAHFGVESIEVSSKAQNLGAARKVMKVIKSGDCIGITPDGPRGPRREMKTLPLEWAKLSQSEIWGITYSVRHAFFLKSWDRFMVPLPFNRGVFIVRPAFSIPKTTSDEEMETHRLKLQTFMNEMTAEADRRCGRLPALNS